MLGFSQSDFQLSQDTFLTSDLKVFQVHDTKLKGKTLLTVTNKCTHNWTLNIAATLHI